MNKDEDYLERRIKDLENRIKEIDDKGHFYGVDNFINEHILSNYK
ncbi:hypothetical protein PALS2_275 [Staphylococcus phage PALS_2]|nr:hypothetical protein PALS2_275 [Staphylococcus phage PALS_2]BDE75665.1 hypothetical protein [Staphylococcus phage S6]